MDIRFNPSVSAPNLTRGVTGKNIKPVAEHVAERGAEVADVLGGSLNTQMTQDLKALHRAVEAQDTKAGKNALSSTNFQTAAMVAGALLGANGMVVQDMAGQLHRAVTSPEGLEKFASAVRNVADGGAASNVLTGLSNQVLQSNMQAGTQRAPVSLFLSGGFLQNEQSEGILHANVAQRQDNAPLDFLMADPTQRRGQ